MRAVLSLLFLGIALAAGAAAPAPQREPAPAPARVEAYFTPGDDVARVIAERIAASLAKAAQRGVAVDVIGDAKQQEAGGLPVLRSLDRAGVRVWLQGEYAAFHNKVILVDAGTPSAVVITGSYNFTRAAQEKNAENIVVVSGSPALAARFAADFERHLARASRLQ